MPNLVYSINYLNPNSMTWLFRIPIMTSRYVILFSPYEIKRLIKLIKTDTVASFVMTSKIYH